MSYTIYALHLTGDTEARYVGMTSRTPESRLLCLTREARLYGRRPTEGLGGWLLDHEGGIDATALVTAATKADAHAKERMLVGICLGLNHRLLNAWLVPAEKRQTEAA